MPGDIVVVERRNTANAGHIVDAFIDNEYTLKILGRENNLHVLIPANEDYPILRPENGFEIIWCGGRAVQEVWVTFRLGEIRAKDCGGRGGGTPGCAGEFEQTRTLDCLHPYLAIVAGV